MNIINRNLFRLLNRGAFNHDSGTLEPMSKYKWQRLFAIATQHNVTNIITPQLNEQKTHPNFMFPEELTKAWTEAAKNNEEKENEAMTVGNKEKLRFANFLINRKLKNIIEQERHEIDANTETVYLLKLYITITTAMLGPGMKLSQLIRIGKYLREKGDKVDYVKFEKWIDTLSMHRMTDTISSMLMQFFDFQKEEFPFLHEQVESAARTALIDLNSTAPREIHFTEGSAGFVVSNSGRATMWHISNSARMMKYCPKEAASNFFHNIFSSLSEIEE